MSQRIDPEPPTSHELAAGDLSEKASTDSTIATSICDSDPVDTLPFTRSAVASVLQVSVRTVRRWEGTILHPVKGPDGTHLFDPAEVQELAKRRPRPSPAKNSTSGGEVAAAAFSLFKKKVSSRDVVIELEQSPAVVQKLHEDWERLGGRLVVEEEILSPLDRMVASRLIDDEVVTAMS